MASGPVTLRTDDGVELAAELSVPEAPVAAAVLAHPHPLMGGDMRTPVPDALFRALPERSVAALRFDFRGAGRSSGTHGGGEDEALDVRAAAEHLAAAVGGSGTDADVPIWLVGWSFGADVSLQVVDDHVAGWVLIAPPLRTVPVTTMAAAGDRRPKLLLVPEHDQYNDPTQAEQLTDGWAATSIQVIPGTDHFLTGQLGTLVDLVVAATTRPVGPAH